MPAWLTWTFVALLSWGVWAVMSKVLGVALTREALRSVTAVPASVCPPLPSASVTRGMAAVPARPRGLAVTGRASARGVLVPLRLSAAVVAVRRGLLD